MPVHHVGLNVTDLDQAREFYQAALKPLGYKISVTLVDGKVLGFGAPFGGPDFWISGLDVPKADGSDVRHKNPEKLDPTPREPSGPMHVAFAAPNRQKVREFHAAAIAAGGKCNGVPGTRPEYFATYYGAFVMDPEGRNIEAVCLKPGFWAEPWGFLGWGIVGLVGGAAGGIAGRWLGYL